MTKIDLRTMKTNRVPSRPRAPRYRKIRSFLEADLFQTVGIGIKGKEAIYHELAILLQSGVVLKSALDLLIAGEKGKKLSILISLRDAIVEGTSFSDAMQNHSIFTPYEWMSIQIGEETGELPAVMINLADYYKKILKQRRQVIGAMMYPAIVMITAFGAVWFMLNFIVPMFGDIFQRSGGSLPAVTKWIIRISSFLQVYGPGIFVLLSVLCAGGYMQRKQRWFRRLSAILLLKLPIIGAMVRKVHLARFCNSMALLAAAKIPLVTALSLSRKMSVFYPIVIALKQVEEAVVGGDSLHQSMEQHKIFDKKMISLLKVGEEVNEMAVFFGKIADQYQEDVEHQSSLLSAMMEPFIIIFLGLFVGIILIAMYLPLFQLGSGFE